MKKIISGIIYVIYSVFYIRAWSTTGRWLGDEILDLITESAKINTDTVEGAVDAYTFTGIHHLGQFVAMKFLGLSFLTVILILLTVVLYHINFTKTNKSKAE